MLILFVEDDPCDVEVIQAAMARAFGQVQLVAMSGVAQAIDYLRPGPGRVDAIVESPSVIFLDLKLDGPPGSELIEVVRADGRLAYTPIVMLTDSDNPDDIAECYRLGANAYISKTSRDEDLATRFVKSVRFWTQINQIPVHPIRPST